MACTGTPRCFFWGGECLIFESKDASAATAAAAAAAAAAAVEVPL